MRPPREKICEAKFEASWRKAQPYLFLAGVAGLAGGLLPGLPVLRRLVVAELLQPVGVVVHHLDRALGREAEPLALELRVGVAVEEGREVVLLILVAEAVLLALEERIEVDDGALAAVEGGLVLIGDRDLRRLAGLDARR